MLQQNVQECTIFKFKQHISDHVFETRIVQDIWSFACLSSGDCCMSGHIMEEKWIKEGVGFTLS